MSGSPTPAVATVTQTKEDKQIKILCLQIRLAELNRDSAAASAHASASAPSHTSLSQMPCNSLEEASTPSSRMSLSLSYFNGHSRHDSHNNSFVNNSHMISDHGYVPDASGETSSGVDTTSWLETFNFAA